MVLGYDTGKGESASVVAANRKLNTPVCLRIQAVRIQSELDELTEAHVHALVNVTQHTIVVLQEAETRLMCMLYQPGYTAASEITRHVLNDMLAERVPPLIVCLERHHFSAMLPVVSRNVYELDDE